MSCCPPPTGLARLAEHPAVVTVAYLAAFTPWGFLYAFDFISSKWRSIRDTRRAGYLHLCFSVVPLAYVCFYVHVQRLAQDYKEMSASIAAAVLCIFHIGRTVWGLAQLKAFASWNLRALKCLRNMKYIVKAPKELGWRRERLFDESAPISDAVDHGMLVNNSLVDNEFSGAELPVHLRISNGFRIGMCCERPTDCSISWVTAFLCRFGAEFLKDSRIIDLMRERRRLKVGQGYLDVVMYAFFHVTASTRTEGTGNRELRYVVSHISPLLWELQVHMTSTLYRREPILRNAFPYGYAGPVRPFANRIQYLQSTLDDAKSSWAVSALNHMSEDDREAVQSISIEHFEYFMGLMEQDGKDWKTYREKTADSSNFLKVENHEDAVASQVLLSQLGYAREKSLEDVTNGIPIKKEFILSFLWEKETNKCLLQASVHIDNCAAVMAGYCGRKKGINGRGPSEGYNNGYPHDWVSAGVPASIFEQQRNIEVYLLNAISTKFTFEHVPQKMGCVMDFVRSSLASWLHLSRTSAREVNWNPKIERSKHEIMISQQLFDEMELWWASFLSAGLKLKMKLVWECQYNLQRALTESTGSQELHESPLLMMLCVLGFPALQVSHAEGRIFKFDILPQNAPQDIYLQVSLIDRKSRRFSIEMIKPAHVRTFRWQDWKDATMGRLAGQSQWMQENEGLNDDRLYLDARPTKLSDPMIEIDRQDTGLSQNLKYWTGWPPFHPRFGGFEMGQFNLSEEDVVSCEDMDKGRTTVDISSIDNTENEKFRKIERALIQTADGYINPISSGIEEERLMED